MRPSWFHSGELTAKDVSEINKLLAKASLEACERTWAAGRPITIAEDGWVVQKWKDGRTIKIKRL